jgi:hypothetical protein
VSDICGFFFQDPPIYQPPPDLDDILRAGLALVYIGLGSIAIGDAAKMSSLILDAIRFCGVRAILSRGWSNPGDLELESVFYLGDYPHKWLFQHGLAAVHHADSGTTVCGLPTMIVPFLDESFFHSFKGCAPFVLILNLVSSFGVNPTQVSDRCEPYGSNLILPDTTSFSCRSRNCYKMRTESSG